MERLRKYINFIVICVFIIALCYGKEAVIALCIGMAIGYILMRCIDRNRW